MQNEKIKETHEACKELIRSGLIKEFVYNEGNHHSYDKETLSITFQNGMVLRASKFEISA